jgi:hypothetical protein
MSTTTRKDGLGQMNGRDLRKAIDERFKGVYEYDHLSFTVRTRHGRSYELPVLEVYITHTPNYTVYEELQEFIFDWFKQHKNELKVKAPRQYYVSRGIKFPWPSSTNREESITGIEIILGAFAI